MLPFVTKVNGLKEKIQKLNLNERTYERLKFISKVTSIPMTRIISEVIDAIFSLSINYDKATFRCFDVVTEDTVNIIIHGYGKKLTVSHFKADFNTPNEQLDKESEERTRARIALDLAEQSVKEDFGEDGKP